MTELEIEGLERNLAENDSYKEEQRGADDTVKLRRRSERYFDRIGSRWGDWQS